MRSKAPKTNLFKSETTVSPINLVLQFKWNVTREEKTVIYPFLKIIANDVI